MSAAIIGSTGLVGSNILSTLLGGELFKPINTITRRAPKAESPNLNAIIDADTTKWAAALAGLEPKPSVVFSALGTTRAAAGGIANQWKIDHDLNVELAKASKEAGVKTFVFISSAGSQGFTASFAPYSKMKKGVEDTIQGLEFGQSIILRPGMIFGEREESRAAEGLAGGLIKAIGKISSAAHDALGQEAEVIARAAVHAVQLAGQGKAPNKHWVLEGSDIIRLGRTEWPAKST